jgi:hypothetical protein
MTQLINETKRMQFLAGLITESQLNEVEESTTPEQAAQIAPKIADKLEADPSIDKIAANIAKDPKATKELMNILNKYGINPASLNENIDNAAEKLALTFAKKADQMLVTISEEKDITGRVMAGLVNLFGGAVLAPYLAQKFEVFTSQYVNAFGDKLTNPEGWVPIAGAIAGVLLTVIGAKVYDMIAGEED